MYSTAFLSWRLAQGRSTAGSRGERGRQGTHQREEGDVQAVDDGHHARPVRTSLLEDAIVEDVLKEIENVVHDGEALRNRGGSQLPWKAKTLLPSTRTTNESPRASNTPSHLEGEEEGKAYLRQLQTLSSGRGGYASAKCSDIVPCHLDDTDKLLWSVNHSRSILFAVT